MIEAGTLESIIKRKEESTEFSELYSRHDTDYAFWTMQLHEWQKKHPFDKRAINKVGNDPRSLIDKAQAILVNSELTISVELPEDIETDDRERDANNKVRLFEHCFEKADDRLRKYLQPNLRVSMSWGALVRGMVAIRVLIYQNEKGEIVYDLMWYDPRYVSYEIGRDGVEWVSYKMYRNKQRLRLEMDKNWGEMKKESQQGFVKRAISGIRDAVIGGSNTVEVRDVWDREYNYVIGEGQFIDKPWKHGFEDIPIVITPVGTSAKVFNENGLLLKDCGESVIAPNRLLYEQVDRLNSIWATHAQLLALRPLVNYRSAQGAPIADNEIPYAPGAVMELKLNENKLEGLPVADIPRSLEVMIGNDRASIQRASWSDVQYGQLSQMLSGRAIEELKEEEDKVLGPRIKAIESTVKDICEHLKDQIVKQGLSIPISLSGQNGYSTYDMVPDDIGSDYNIKVDLVHRESWKQLEAYAVYKEAVQSGAMSEEMAREHILKLPDARGEKMKIDIEQAEKAYPQLILHRIGKAYKERGVEMEVQFNMINQLINIEVAKLNLQEAEIITKYQQTQMGGFAPPQEQTPPQIPEQGGMNV